MNSPVLKLASAMGFAAGLLAWPCAQAADASAENQAADRLCEGIATRVRALPANPIGSRVNAPIERLADQPRPYVNLDHAKRIEADDMATLRGQIQRDYKASKPVMAAIDAIVSPGLDEMWLRRLGRSSVWAMEGQAGTMDCSDFVFFDAPEHRPARLIPRPPQYQANFDSGEEPTGFCVSDRGLLGEVGHAPAFIEQYAAPTDPDFDIVVSRWWDGRWQRPCEVKVSYQPIYRVSKIHCRGSVCAALPEIVRDLVAHRERHYRQYGEQSPDLFTWGPKPSPTEQAKIARIEKLIGLPVNTAFPTLGDKVDQEEKFGEDGIIVPVQITGHTYAALLSHRWIGWRVFPQYVVGIYDLRNDKPQPIAGLIVDQNQGRLTSVQTMPWQKSKPKSES